MVHRAWAIMPTSMECSLRFSSLAFLIRAQRSIYFILAMVAKKL
jgi:hypothetical protein